MNIFLPICVVIKFLILNKILKKTMTYRFVLLYFVLYLFETRKFIIQSTPQVSFRRLNKIKFFFRKKIYKFQYEDLIDEYQSNVR